MYRLATLGFAGAHAGFALTSVTLATLKDCATALSSPLPTVCLNPILALDSIGTRLRFYQLGLLEWRSSLTGFTTLTSGLEKVSIVEPLWFLGYKVGRGAIELDCFASEKISITAQAIPLLQLGSASNAVIGNVIAFSCAWHVLQVASPSPGLRRTWHSAVGKLILGGSA
eukprot:5468679-Amphidinium_carterae.1